MVLCGGAAAVRGVLPLLQVNWQGGGMQTAGKVFEVRQFQFHAPSEHTVDGMRYPLEMHFVHVAPEDQTIAVVAVLFKHGGWEGGREGEGARGQGSEGARARGSEGARERGRKRVMKQASKGLGQSNC